MIKSTESFEFEFRGLVEEDWCNEVIRIRYMLIEIRRMTNKNKTFGKVIIIDLNLNQQDSYKYEFMLREKIQTLKFMKEWSVDLPALKDVECLMGDCQLLEPTIFQKMTHLQRLVLSENRITVLNRDVFAGLNSLIYLDISQNNIKFLPPNLFKDLINLDFLELSSNQIEIIPEGLFKNLVNLELLDLSGNKIDLVEQSATIFQNLRKLKILYLGDNEIKDIPEGLFRDLVDLKEIDMSDNQFEVFSKEFFQELAGLKFLQISDDDFDYENESDRLKDTLQIPANIQICGIDLYHLLEANEEENN